MLLSILHSLAIPVSGCSQKFLFDKDPGRWGNIRYTAFVKIGQNRIPVPVQQIECDPILLMLDTGQIQFLTKDAEIGRLNSQIRQGTAGFLRCLGSDEADNLLGQRLIHEMTARPNHCFTGLLAVHSR